MSKQEAQLLLDKAMLKLVVLEHHALRLEQACAEVTGCFSQEEIEEAWEAMAEQQDEVKIAQLKVDEVDKQVMIEGPFEQCRTCGHADTCHDGGVGACDHVMQAGKQCDCQRFLSSSGRM